MYPASTKFLIVDDHATMRKYIMQSLRQMGYYNIIEAVDGQSALFFLKEHYHKNTPVEFIISDWNMPNMKGIDLLKQCRSTPEFKSIPFILVTGERDREKIIEAANSGVSDYIIKPFSEVKIKHKMEKIYIKHHPGKISA